MFIQVLILLEDFEELCSFIVWFLVEVKVQVILIEKFWYQLVGYWVYWFGVLFEMVEQLQLVFEISEIVVVVMIVWMKLLDIEEKDKFKCCLILDYIL